MNIAAPDPVVSDNKKPTPAEQKPDVDPVEYSRGKIKSLYDAVSKDYNVGDLNTFTTKLQDQDKRKALYDAIGSKYNLGSFDEFTDKVVPHLPKKNESSTPYFQQNLKGEGISSYMKPEDFEPSQSNDAISNMIKNSLPAEPKQQPEPEKGMLDIKILHTPQHINDNYIQSEQGQKVLQEENNLKKFNAAMQTATGNPDRDGWHYLQLTDPGQYKKMQDLGKAGLQPTYEQRYNIEMQGVQNNLAYLNNSLDGLQRNIRERERYIDGVKDPKQHNELVNELENSKDYQDFVNGQIEYKKMQDYADKLPDKYPEIKKEIEKQKQDQQYYDNLPTAGKLLYDTYAGLKNFGVGTVAGLERLQAFSESTSQGLSPKQTELNSRGIDNWEAANTLTTKPNLPGTYLRGMGELIPNIMLLATGEGAVKGALEASGLTKAVSAVMGRTAAIGLTSYGNYFDEAHKAGYGSGDAAMIAGLGTLKDVALMSVNTPTEMLGKALGFSAKIKEAGILDMLKDPERYNMALEHLKGIGATSLKQGLEGAGQAALFQAANEKFDNLINKKPGLNAGDVNALRQNMIINGLASAIIPAVGGISSISGFRSRFIRDALYEAGNNPDQLKSVIDHKVADGQIRAEDAGKMKERIDDMHQVMNKIDHFRVRLSEPMFKQVATNEYNKLRLKEQLDNALTDEQKQGVKDKISIVDNNTNKLLGLEIEKPSYTVADQPVSEQEAKRASAEGVPDVKGEGIKPMEPPKPAEQVRREELAAKHDKIDNRLNQINREAETHNQDVISAGERGEMAQQEAIKKRDEFLKDAAKEKTYLENEKQLLNKYGMGTDDLIKKLKNEKTEEGKNRLIQKCPDKAKGYKTSKRG